MIQTNTLQSPATPADSAASRAAATAVSGSQGADVPEAPEQVLQAKLDSALMARFQASVEVPQAPEPAGPSPVVPLVLGLVLVGVLLLVRALARGDDVVGRWRRRGAPRPIETAPPPDPEAPVSAPRRDARAGGGGRAVARRPGRQPAPIQLPPHVAALLANMEERKAQGGRGSGEDAAPDASGGAGGGGGVNVVIGG